MTRARLEAQREVEANLVGAAALKLPTDQQIRAVEEVRDFCWQVSDALRPAALPIKDQERLRDLPALLEAEAEDRAKRGDPTAPVWIAAAQQMRLRAAITQLEAQIQE